MENKEIVLIPAIRNPEQVANKYCKILMLGAKNVGKTAIMNYHMHDILCHENYRKPCNNTATYSSVVMRDLKIEYVVLDEPAQQNYPKPSYFKMCYGYVIVYDITSMESWMRIKQLLIDIDRWGPPKFNCKVIIGNKCDKDSERKVPYKQVFDFVKAREIPYIETSALTGQNIVEAFGILMNDIAGEFVKLRSPESINLESGLIKLTNVVHVKKTR